jgi:hypothetical protein
VLGGVAGIAWLVKDLVRRSSRLFCMFAAVR